jgi:hypothetical protein
MQKLDVIEKKGLRELILCIFPFMANNFIELYETLVE